MFALLQLGETHAAERELRYLWMEMPEEYRLGVMRFASEQGMAGLSFRVARLFAKTLVLVGMAPCIRVHNSRLNILLMKRWSGRFRGKNLGLIRARKVVLKQQD